jgi:hypothetical protein
MTAGSNRSMLRLRSALENFTLGQYVYLHEEFLEKQ